MTIAYCWLDQSLARNRITAVADSRISHKVNGAWAPLQEETIKLFRIPILCHSMSSLDYGTGTWRDPYFSTEVGLGFAGDCFEALSILNAYERAVAQLVVDGDGQPLPEPQRLYCMLREVMRSWLRTYKREGAEVQFLLFGYAPQDGLPWAGRIKWPEVSGLDGDQFELPMRDSSVFIIGDERVPSGLAYANKVRSLFMKKVGKLNFVELRKAGFEPDLEEARRLNADRMYLEDDVASVLLDHTRVTVGGVMQKIEVFPQEGNRARVAFSRDDAGYADAFGEVAPKLAYRSVAEVMGTKGRPTP